MKKLLESFKYALHGIHYAFHSQRNIKIHFIVALVVFMLGIWYRISAIEWIVLLLTISMVITGEMVNTAIEKTIDLVTEEYKVLAKISKDVAAGAVLISSIAAVAIGIIIFYNKIL
ncbi:MAG: diacylglycerol kinase family protein [Eubacteriales bacterium]